MEAKDCVQALRLGCDAAPIVSQVGETLVENGEQSTLLKIYVCPWMREGDKPRTASKLPRANVLPQARIPKPVSPVSIREAASYSELLHYVRANPVCTTRRSTFLWLRTVNW